MSSSSALKVLQEAEKHSQIFSKVNITIKDQNKGGVRNILFPTKKKGEKN